MRRLLVTGGSHGGAEEFPPEFVGSLRRDPIPGVWPEITNEEAVARGVVTIEHPLTMMVAFGVREPRNNEERCANKLEHMAKEFDGGVDVHTSPTVREPYAYVGVKAQPIVWHMIAELGLRQVMLVDMPGSLYEHVRNMFVIEFPESMRNDEAGQRRFREQLGRMAAAETLSADPDCTFYGYAGWVPLERADPEAPDFIEDFTRLEPERYQHLGHQGPLYALGWFPLDGSVRKGEMAREVKGCKIENGVLLRPKKGR